MRMSALLCAGLALGLAGCEKSEEKPETPYGAAKAAWEEAELEVEELTPAEKGSLRGAESCQVGRVSGLHVMLCEFADASVAEKAEERGLGRVGDKTGLSIARDRLLLVASDEDEVDPNGKKLNQLGKAFRQIELPDAKAGEPEEEAAKGVGDGEGTD